MKEMKKHFYLMEEKGGLRNGFFYEVVQRF